MGFTDSMRSLFRARDEPEAAEIDRDEKGAPLYREDIIAFVKGEAEKRRSERISFERQWTLNANFLMGNQWCAINTFHEGSPVEELPRCNYYEQRETFNRIAPLYLTRDANLSKVTYDMLVRPATDEEDDLYKSEISTAILKAAKKATNFDAISKTARSWAEITGNAFYHVYWDKNGGEEYAREETVTIGDDGTVKKEVDVIKDGEVALSLLSPYEVFPESLYKQGVEAQRSIITQQIANADEASELFSVKLEGSTLEAFDIVPSPSTGGLGYISTVSTISTHTVENAVKVISYFEKPCKAHPDGRTIIVAGDELVFYGALPFGQIPIVQQVCQSVAGQFFGKTWIEDVIPVQRAYNGVVNKLHDYIKSCSANTLLVENGSIENIEELEENGVEPGGVISYKKGFERPYPLANGSLPSEVSNEVYRLASEMEYMAGLSHLQMYGSTENSVTAASSIAQLREVDDTRLSQTAESIRRSVKRIAEMWLKLYKKHAKINRCIKATGLNLFGDVIVWCREDISDNDITFVTENELLNSPEKQQERFMQAWQMGLFADENGVVPENVKNTALKMFKSGDWSNGTEINELQTSRATRENNLFESGAVPTIGEMDDHEIHIEEHTRYVLGVRFELLKHRKPEYAQLIIQHINEHKAQLSMGAQLQNQQNIQ